MVKIMVELNFPDVQHFERFMEQVRSAGMSSDEYLQFVLENNLADAEQSDSPANPEQG